MCISKLTNSPRKEGKIGEMQEANLKLDLEHGFAKRHLTKDVEEMGLDDFYKWATQKKNLTQEKKKRAIEKISAFGDKLPKSAISGRTSWEGNLGLKAAKIMKEYWKKTRAKPKKAAVKNLKSKRESASAVAGIAHAAK